LGIFLAILFELKLSLCLLVVVFPSSTVFTTFSCVVVEVVEVEEVEVEEVEEMWFVSGT